MIKVREISPSEQAERAICPFCKKPLPVGIVKDGKCNGAVTVCKHCKRNLTIETDESPQVTQ